MMNKYQKAFNRIDSVIGTHLVFTKLLDSKSEWGDYLYCTNEVDAEFAMDADFEILQELIDNYSMKETPMKPSHKHKLVYDDTIYNFGRCPKCTYEVKIKMAYCSNCGQKLDWADTDWND